MTHLWTSADATRMLRVPGAEDDKFSRGVVGLRTGSVMYPGAAVLSVEGAWRAGAGVVRWVGEPEVGMLILARRPETVMRPGRVDAWVIGSGTDRTVRTPDEADTIRILLEGDIPVVVDAGALDLVDHPSAPTVITPHRTEFARLADGAGIALSGEREKDARTVAAALDTTVLLKGSDTVIADPDGRVVHVQEGTGWLATAGAGDVLSGMIGSIIAQTRTDDLLAAAATAAFLHGRAGRIAADVGGGRGHPIVALDVAAALGTAFADVRSEG